MIVYEIVCVIKKLYSVVLIIYNFILEYNIVFRNWLSGEFYGKRIDFGLGFKYVSIIRVYYKELWDGGGGGREENIDR